VERVRYVDKKRWIGVLGFATIYFFTYATSIVYFTTKSLPPTPEYSWYFQDPWTALRTILSYALFELPRSPLMMLSIFTIAAKSFILGFMTDWVLRVLKRHTLLRKRGMEANI